MMSLNHKSLNLKDVLSFQAPRGFDVMPNTLLMRRNDRIRKESSPQAHLGFAVIPTTVALLVARDDLRKS